MSLHKNCGWWKNSDCIFEFSVKSYVTNTINLSWAKILLPSVMGMGNENARVYPLFWTRLLVFNPARTWRCCRSPRHHCVKFLPVFSITWRYRELSRHAVLTIREKFIKLPTLDNIRPHCFCPKCDNNNTVVLGGGGELTSGRVYMHVIGTCEQTERGNKEIKTLE